MKTRITALFVSTVFLAATMTATAEEKREAAGEKPGALAVAADAVVVRPIAFASTVVGSALFVLALPIAAITKSTKSTADALVVGPARATFQRPLGDLDALADD